MQPLTPDPKLETKGANLDQKYRRGTPCRIHRYYSELPARNAAALVVIIIIIIFITAIATIIIIVIISTAKLLYYCKCCFKDYYFCFKLFLCLR